jgi:hypothetical protein
MSFEVYDVEHRFTLGASALDVSFAKEDQVVVGNREAGVADDPLELPADEELAEELYGQVKERLLNAVRAELGWTGRKLYVSYRRAREIDDADAAVSYAVLALKSQMSSGAVTLDEDFDYLFKKTGFSLKDGRQDWDLVR